MRVHMKAKPQITIHYGASNDDVTVDGAAFTFHKLDRSEKSKLRRIIVGALEGIGYFQKGGSK
jgi:hypothetical protein